MKLRGLCVMCVFLAACAAPVAPRARDTAATPAATTVVVAPDKPLINVRAIVIVRHANIDVTLKNTMGNATPLLPAGVERAKGLIPMLREAGITRIVVSPALRTQQTAAAVAEALKIQPEEGPAGGSDMVKFLAESAKPEQTILLVHHHSVIPSILAGFGFAQESEAVDATEFDRVYIIVPDGARRSYQLFRVRYGGTW